MKAGSNLERILNEGKFAATAELGPPKSADAEVVQKKADLLKGKVDAVNITDNQTAIVRMSSLGAAKLTLDKGLEPVMQMVCRDRNRIAIQSDMLGAYALGVRNLLCLTGDHQKFGNHPTSKNVFDLDSIQLLDMMRNMRDNKVFQCGDEIRNSKKAPIVEPKLFLGAAENPFAHPYEFRAIRLAKKVNAGADFIQTQCIFDVPRFKEWMKEVVDMGLHEKTHILAGVMPVKSAGQVKYMKKNVAGMSIPDSLVDRMKGASDPKAEGVDFVVELIDEVRQIEGIRGVHIMAVEWEEMVPTIAERAGLLPRP